MRFGFRRGVFIVFLLLIVLALYSATTSKTSTKSSGCTRQCVAVLTGHPRVSERLEYVVRILRQLRQQVVASDGNKMAVSSSDECGARKTDVFVYCDGDCGDALTSEFEVDTWLHFLRLPDKAAKPGVVFPTDSTATQSPTNRGQSPNQTIALISDLDRLAATRADSIQRSRLYKRHRGEMGDDVVHVELSGIRFVRDRWMAVSNNYRRMLDDLFIANRSTSGSHSVRFDEDSYCSILEDDLVLAADSLVYLQAVERVMSLDRTIFTGSLFNDNSYPLYAIDPSSFRRVGHFAGLGFVISGRRYVKELRPTWGGMQNWDEAVQRLVARHRLVSIVPEVTRAVHLRRRDDGGHLDAIWNVPRHPFESQQRLVGEHKTFPTAETMRYDLSRFVASVYDERLAETIRRSSYIEHLADALFFHSIDDVIVYWNCADESDLGRILDERHLWAVGNGGVVRGSYRGTLSFRYLTALVLIVCRHSDFRSLRVADRPAYLTDVSGDGKLNAFDGIDRQFVGIIHRLTADYRVAVGAENDSCDLVCDDNNDTSNNVTMTSSSACDIRGMWLANESCEVVRYFIPECRRCVRATIDAYVGGVLPGVEVATAGGDGLLCATAYPHYISCRTSSPGYHRLCVCKRR